MTDARAVEEPSERGPGAISRRALLHKAGVAAAFGAATISTPAWARRPSRKGRRQTVAILGGGIAGLTAAHELAARGFDVTVYERRAWGGKARSVDVPGSASGGRRPLPGEHGYRMFFGFYQNLPDSMRRIPSGPNTNVFDNLVPATQLNVARAPGRDYTLPLGGLDPRPYTPDQIRQLLQALLLETDLPPGAIARFADRLAVYLSSCAARRTGQWERTSWADFIDADRYSDDYKKIIALPLSQIVQASKSEHTSADFSGWFLELLINSMLGRHVNGSAINILNRPTNEAFIDPWLDCLRELNVRLKLGAEVVGLTVNRGRVAGAKVRTATGVRDVVADWFVCALPAEVARGLWNKNVLAAAPELAGMARLKTGAMNGLQFYLRNGRPITTGHFLCPDTPWLVSGIKKAQFWEGDFAHKYGDGRADDCLSAIISDWNTPGSLHGKPAKKCTDREIAEEAWHQIKASVNDTGEAKLTDDQLVSWALDPGLVRRKGRLINQDPLVLPTVNQRQYRPDVDPSIPNLFLAGDYLQSGWQVANMEAACFNARRAVNALLERAGSDAAACAAIGPFEPPEWNALKRIDAERYRRGQPNLLELAAAGVV